MAERRLPPALEAKVYDSHIWVGDVLDWLYGTDSEGWMTHEHGPCWESIRTPGLVERMLVELRRVSEEEPLTEWDVENALRAELGEEEE